jgi:hypothetical protein
VSTVRENRGKLDVIAEVSISFPRFATTGGFVFRRNQEPIRELGVIIPEVVVPDGEDADSDRYAVNVRLERLDGAADEEPVRGASRLGLRRLVAAF